MNNDNNLRMHLKNALTNMWARITTRVDSIASCVGVTEDRLDEIEDSIDDLEGDMIKSITFNGTAVPKDAQGNVALQETDPTVPAWAKQVKAKTSDFTNDGADGVHPYISQGDVTVPTKTSDLLNDGDDGTTYYVTWRQLSDSKDQAFIDENYIELTQDNIRREFTKDEHYQGEAFFMYASPAGLTAMLPNGSQYTRYTNCTFRGLVYTSKQYMTLDDYNMVGWMEGPGIHELVTGYIDTDWSGEDPTIYITEITQIGGSGSGGDVNIIEAISFNGTNVPPDAGKRVSLTETDPTVPAWAKAASKPTYTAQEVGALPANTPIPSKTSDLTNDSGFLTSSTGVTGVKGNAEASYRQGNVNITPANIGAVAKSGDMMTGPLTTNSAIIQNSGYIFGADENDATNHALKLGHAGDNVMQFLEYGGQFEFYQSQNGTNTLLFQVKNGASSAPLPVNNGGTDATDAATARANLEITPKNIGVLRTSYKLAQGVIQANSSYDFSFYGVSLDDYTFIVMGQNPYTNQLHEGYTGPTNVALPTLIVKYSSNQYAPIISPDNTWGAWFPGNNTIHVENHSSSDFTFRCDVYV